MITVEDKADVTRKIYFEPAGRVHSSQWDLINCPPEGYEFVTGKSILDKTLVSSDFFFLKLHRTLEWLLPLNLTKAWVERFTRKIPESVDLLYTYNLPVFRKMPWVIFVEWAHVLVGRDMRHFNRYKTVIERRLASDYCKAILTWTELAKRSILVNFGCADFEHKIEVVPQAVHKKDFIKNYNDGKIKLLFVGSANVLHDFDCKGGKEALEAFSTLNRKYDNLELVVRARIPQAAKHEYRGVLAMQNVLLIEELQPWEVLESEFVTADIFLHPTHELHNTVILDAMSYELPVITTEIGSTGRIENGVTGFVIKHPDLELEDVIVHPPIQGPHEYKFERIYQTTDSRLVEELVAKASLLIENPELRRRMGKAARWEVEEGKFSIQKRNEKLKRIFDAAIS